MNEESRKLLEKAQRAVEAAETLRGHGDADFAAARAYYAMFYAAEALLHEKGLGFRKHGGVHAAFGEHFVKTGALDPKFHRYLLDAFDQRLLADYGVEATLTSADASMLIGQASELSKRSAASSNRRSNQRNELRPCSRRLARSRAGRRPRFHRRDAGATKGR